MAQLKKLAMNFVTKSSGTVLILTFFGGCMGVGYAGNMFHQYITGLDIGGEQSEEVAIKPLTPKSFEIDSEVAALRASVFSPK